MCISGRILSDSNVCEDCFMSESPEYFNCLIIYKLVKCYYLTIKFIVNMIIVQNKFFNYKSSLIVAVKYLA